MKTTRHLAALISLSGVLVLGSAPALGAGLTNNENSAGPTGMAGAVTAIADAPSAGYYNPAGLATQTGLGIEAGMTLMAATTSYKGIAPGTNTEVQVDGFQPVPLPFGHVAYRIHDRVAAGISTYFSSGLGANYPDTVNVNGTTTPWWGRGSVKNFALYTLAINPNVAVKLHDRIYLGAGVSVVKGVMTIERALTVSRDPADDLEMKLSAESWGVGATGGVLFKVLPGMLNVGVTYRSAVKLTLDGEVAYTQQGSPARVSPSMRTMAVDGPAEVELKLPHSFAFGVAGFPIKGLTLGLEVDYTTWSSYDRLRIWFPENPATNVSEPKAWNNTVTVRVGAEYRVLPYLPVRAGFIFDQASNPPLTMAPDSPDSNRYEATVGVGYEFLDFHVDAAYQFRTTSFVEAAEGSPMGGAYRLRMHIASATLGYKLDI